MSSFFAQKCLRSFSLRTVWGCNFCQKNISAKATCKMLVKLKVGVEFTKLCLPSKKTLAKILAKNTGKNTGKNTWQKHWQKHWQKSLAKNTDKKAAHSHVDGTDNWLEGSHERVLTKKRLSQIEENCLSQI